MAGAAIACRTQNVGRTADVNIVHQASIPDGIYYKGEVNDRPDASVGEQCAETRVTNVLIHEVKLIVEMPGLPVIDPDDARHFVVTGEEAEYSCSEVSRTPGNSDY